MLSKVEFRASLSTWYSSIPGGSGSELRIHSTVVGGKPVEVQVSVKVTTGDVEGVAMAMGVVSCGEAVESATVTM